MLLAAFEPSHLCPLGVRSPFRSSQKSLKKGEERKAEADVNSSSSPKPAGKGETGSSLKSCRLSETSLFCNVNPSSFFFFLSCRSLSHLMYNSRCLPPPLFVPACLPSVPLSQMRQVQPQTELLWLKSVLRYRASVASKLRKVTAGHSFSPNI